MAPGADLVGPFAGYASAALRSTDSHARAISRPGGILRLGLTVTREAQGARKGRAVTPAEEANRSLFAMSSSAQPHPVQIAVAFGDGIGPAIMEATLRILEAAKAPILPERSEIGERVDPSGVTSGIELGARDEDGRDPSVRGGKLRALELEALRLSVVTNRGVKALPDGFPEAACTDHWRCRFSEPDGRDVTHEDVLELLPRIRKAGLDFIQTEHICRFDGKRGSSLGRGE